MAHEANSTMSSPVTVSGVESTSDVESAISVGDKAIVLDTPRNFEGGPFDLGDGDLHLVVNGVTLETHKYFIKKFSGLKNRIRDNAITLDSNEPAVEDFRNTFKILYASVIDGPFHFDHTTLTSALRIATTYDYPSLRNFAIHHLEKASLKAVERIRLAREFGLSSWEEAAYVELCNRDEAMTKEEASVLGLDAFVHVARIREKEQRRRGKDVDAAVESDDESQAGEEPTIKHNQAKGKKRKPKRFTQAATESGLGEEEKDEAKEAPTKKYKEGEIGTIPNPSFIDVEMIGTRWRQAEYYTFVLDAPGCQCTGTDPGGPCALPPCVASAIKHLQTQQLAHDTNILKLETTMERVQGTLLSLAATPEPSKVSDLNEPHKIKSVVEEVRKWLADVEVDDVISVV